MTVETKLRDAAAALLTAWNEAHAAGYRAAWPTRPDGLEGLAISETAAVAAAVPPETLPAVILPDTDKNPFKARKNQLPAD